MDANNYERLDPDDGLLLSPAYNALFGRGYSGFQPTGEITFSPKFTPDNAKLLGASKEARVQALSSGNKHYLAYHLAEDLRRQLSLRTSYAEKETR